MDTRETPILEEHRGIAVVRDDLFPGGSKARFIPELFNGVEEVVYASPCQGGAQYALAFCARELGKRATIFVAHRVQPHPRAFEARALGAKIVQIKPGYLGVVQARARAYAEATGARLAPFGMSVPSAERTLCAVALKLDMQPDEVWASAGSGVLTRCLQAAWPKARHFAVAVGRNIPQDDVKNAALIRYPAPFEAHARCSPPFPSDPHYDAKCWEIMTAREHAGRRVVFWNVAGPARVISS